MVSAPTHMKIILNYKQFLRSLHQNPFAHYFTIFDFAKQSEKQEVKEGLESGYDRKYQQYTHIPCLQRMVIETF
jgi:hypothetical protein